MRAHRIVQTLLVGTAIACAVPAAGMAEPGALPPPAMVMSNAIVITNTGATNLIGYRVVIAADGHAAFATGEGSGKAQLPANLFRQFERNVFAARPLAQLAKQSCMKSASFGTSTFVALDGDRSPDLSCPANGLERALQKDVQRVDAFLGVGNVPRSQGAALPPQDF